MRTGGIIAAATLLGACARVPVVAADPSGQTPTTGDANADGRVDLSDGLLLLRAQMAGGPTATCMGAVDIDQDHRVDLGDAFAIWYHLFAGSTAFFEIEEGWCEDPVALPDAAEGRMALALDLPREATGTAEARVTLTSLDLAVEGWSLAVVAQGCAITAASTAGTAGADWRDQPAGSRDGGFERTELVGGVASSAVALSWLEPRALEPSEEARDLLVLTLEAGSGCDCTLRLEDGHATGGQPVTNLLSVAGRSYRPALPEATLELCPG